MPHNHIRHTGFNRCGVCLMAINTTQKPKNNFSVPFNEAKHVFFGEDLVINDFITIHHPLVHEILEFDEQLYFQIVSLITMRPYDNAVALNKKGFDYQDYTDYDMFLMNASLLKPENTKIFFGEDLDLSVYKPTVSLDTGRKVLVNGNLIIDELIYNYIVTFVRKINYISAKIEYDMGNGIGKRFLLERMERKQKQARKQPFKSHISNIASLVSVMCDYTAKEIKEMPIGELYTHYYRLNCVDERDKLLNAVYAGTMKLGDIKNKSEKLNWAKTLEIDN